MTVAMDSALSGLRAAQRALDAASANIANAGTIGYTRKIYHQESVIIGNQGFGTRATSLTRIVDRALLADINRQISASEGQTARLQYLDRIQAFHGATNSEQAISAKISALADTFTQLSGAPSDTILLNQVLTAAGQITRKINDFAEMLTTMRNDTERQIESAVREVNQALVTVAALNSDITRYASMGQSTAELEDKRDLAVKTIAKYIDISTYQTSNGISITTREGHSLLEGSVRTLNFTPSNIIPSSYYPGGGLNGITLDSTSGFDLATTHIGGQIGALLEMRDSTLPQYTAQLDEMAQKLSERFQNLGLKLFSDNNGNVPASVADPGSTASYVGYSSRITVNPAVLADPTLIRNGTTGGTEPSGSNEVIRRIAQFAFGDYEYQQSTGTTVVPVGPFLIPGTIPLTTNNAISGTVNIASYLTMGDIPVLTSQLPGNFTVAVGGASNLITINPGDTAATVAASINTAFGSSVASINSLGQLTIAGAGAITITAGTINAAGLGAMGLTPGTTPQPNPTFKVQVGTRPPVTITITAGTTSATLLASLNAVPGLSASYDVAGHLVMRPTNGGDLKILDGPGTPLVALGMSTANVAHTTFRQNNLGPGSPAGGLSTELPGVATIEDYSRSMVSAQSEDHSQSKSIEEQEGTYLEALETRSGNLSGVNIDQEMSDLIRIQSSYAAAAKMISAAQKLFDDLMNAFIR